MTQFNEVSSMGAVNGVTRAMSRPINVVEDRFRPVVAFFKVRSNADASCLEPYGFRDLSSHRLIIDDKLTFGRWKQ